jgi:hypothetical protein
MGVFDENIHDQSGNDQLASFDNVMSQSTMNKKDRRFFHKKEL